MKNPIVMIFSSHTAKVWPVFIKHILQHHYRPHMPALLIEEDSYHKMLPTLESKIASDQKVFAYFSKNKPTMNNVAEMVRLRLLLRERVYQYNPYSTCLPIDNALPHIEKLIEIFCAKRCANLIPVTAPMRDAFMVQELIKIADFQNDDRPKIGWFGAAHLELIPRLVATRGYKFVEEHFRFIFVFDKGVANPEVFYNTQMMQRYPFVFPILSLVIDPDRGVSQEQAQLVRRYLGDLSLPPITPEKLEALIIDGVTRDAVTIRNSLRTQPFIAEQKALELIKLTIDGSESMLKAANSLFKKLDLMVSIAEEMNSILGKNQFDTDFLILFISLSEFLPVRKFLDEGNFSYNHLLCEIVKLRKKIKVKEQIKWKPACERAHERREQNPISQYHARYFESTFVIESFLMNAAMFLVRLLPRLKEEGFDSYVTENELSKKFPYWIEQITIKQTIADRPMPYDNSSFPFPTPVYSI